MSWRGNGVVWLRDLLLNNDSRKGIVRGMDAILAFERTQLLLHRVISQALLPSLAGFLWHFRGVRVTREHAL